MKDKDGVDHPDDLSCMLAQLGFTLAGLKEDKQWTVVYVEMSVFTYFKSVLYVNGRYCSPFLSLSLLPLFSSFSSPLPDPSHPLPAALPPSN